jgi:putative PIN family toxin of toxin-antitoxin system
VKVVFDTNVVVSASFWAGAPLMCLAAWVRGEVSAAVSPQLLSEYFDTYEDLALRYPERESVDWPDALAQAAEMVYPQDLARGVTTDPDDEMVLECALAAEAEFLVSGDKKHLLKIREFEGIKIVSCNDLLARLGHSSA